jgi:hypothetical protein
LRSLSIKTHNLKVKIVVTSDLNSKNAQKGLAEQLNASKTKEKMYVRLQTGSMMVVQKQSPSFTDNGSYSCILEQDGISHGFP